MSARAVHPVETEPRFGLRQSETHFQRHKIFGESYVLMERVLQRKCVFEVLCECVKE